MEYKLLGRTGLKVSQLCFGTMSFGGDADEAGSAAMYAACRDRGIKGQGRGNPRPPDGA
jgi:aryl-alcohol dehydrogenase-like predicted oxidoreductase